MVGNIREKFDKVKPWAFPLKTWVFSSLLCALNLCFLLYALLEQGLYLSCLLLFPWVLE